MSLYPTCRDGINAEYQADRARDAMDSQASREAVREQARQRPR
jgi:hypothetical protein